MKPIDPSEESRRLEKLYAQMSDGELWALAEKVNDLTELAQQALRGEMSRRGMEKRVGDAANDDSTPTDGGLDDELVDVWTAKGLSEANSVKQILDYAGIPSCLVPNHVEDVGTFRGDSDGEVKIKVIERDVQRACKALEPHLPTLYAAYPSSAPTPQDNADYVARCPKCHSPDVVFQSLDAGPLGRQAADSKSNWSCDACGHRWQDDGNEKEH